MEDLGSHTHLQEGQCCRPVAMGEPLSRLYASILVSYTEQHGRSPTQAGYRAEHGTIQQACVLQHVIDKHK